MEIILKWKVTLYMTYRQLVIKSLFQIEINILQIITQILDFLKLDEGMIEFTSLYIVHTYYLYEFIRKTC